MKRQEHGILAAGITGSLIVIFIMAWFLGNALGKAPQDQAAAKGIEGDWQGTLKAPGADLRLVLHITKGTDGNLKATLDSIDQNANGIPVTEISLKDSKLTLSVESVGGSYEGKVSSDGTAIQGTWTQMGNSLPLDFSRAATAIKPAHKPAKPSDIDGAWLGTIDAGGTKLRLVFHITNTEDGLTATMDSPDQGAMAIPVTTVTRDGASLKMEMTKLGGVYNGKIAKDLSTIDGTWSQSGRDFPCVLTRVKDTSKLDRPRPQNPVKPYPYHEEEISFDNPAAGIKLAATLTLPQGRGPFPAVELIVGSGPHDRDESLMGHKPFLVLSDYLTRKGIAVLRADKRGVAKSGGNYALATTADFATDADAGVVYLKTRSEIDPRKIGLIGHSEGGVIAPMVAASDPDVAFIVMMAGTGVPGDEILAEQGLLISEAMGTSHEKAETDAAEERELLEMVKREKDATLLEKELREKLAGKVPEAQLGTQIKQITSPWFLYFIAYDPATALRKVKCPVLAINGEKDLQVPPKQNLPAIRKALEAGGNKNFEVDELPGLNHLFQNAKTGSPSEYAEIEETMSPVALEKMSAWILKQ
ncbi:MAG TPA: alpha/beta fold hydrolase [Terriglobia bacterium]|nr:alpha/beta fold hydrolase [Terriglobia bacterium]